MIRPYQKVENVSALPRLFSSKLLSELLKFQESSLFDNILDTTKLPLYLSPSASMGDLFSLSYETMFKRYRNEYIYKNVLAKNVLLGKHSLNTSFMLSEFRVANCKADSLIINGTSTVYEIKSEFDSFDRLLRQIDAYMKAFDKIYVVSSSKKTHLSQLLRLLPSSIGILVLSEKGALSTIRETESHIANADISVIFDTLRKPEYESIVKNHYGYIPNVPNAYSYRECKKLFVEIPLLLAHKYTVNILKHRGKALKSFIGDIPDTLKAYSLRANLSKPERESFMDFLDESYKTFYNGNLRG